MARRRRQQEGLERVLGAPALFATAYGNVGSSIYYALGVTAAFALGLTPLVFLIAGLIFAATAATYAEGTVRYPEAGGSASFARHAFNELVSFGAGWAQMLNYIITIAISAFFVPHYLSIFWEPLKENPWDVIVGALIVVILVAVNIVGVKEAAKLNVLLAVIDFGTQALLVILGFVLIFSPQTLVNNVTFGRRADLGRLLPGDPGRDDRLHRHRDDLEPVGGGARPVAGHPALDLPRRDRGVRDLLHAPGHRAVRAPGDAGVRRRLHHRPGAAARRRAATPTTRCWAWSTTWASTARPSRAGDLRRGAGRHDPAHRGQRGRDRRLAHHLFDVELPAAAGAIPPPPPAVQDAVAGAGGVRRLRGDPRAAAGPDRLPGHDLLVRGDAVVHDRPRLPDRAPGAKTGRRAHLPCRAERAVPGDRLAAVRDPRRPRDRDRVAGGGRCRSR